MLQDRSPSSAASANPPHWGRRVGWMLATVMLAALAYGAHGVYSGAVTVPERFNPWATLDVAASPNFLTGYKLARTRSSPALCETALQTTGMQYDPLPDRVTGDGCGFENAVRLRRSGLRLGAPLTLSCPMALSFFMWERHALQPAAQTHFGQRVVAIEHLGSYACRNINRGEGAAPGTAAALPASRSQHATANALDIAGFTLADGRRITVQSQWAAAAAVQPPDPAALLLQAAHQGACSYFEGVLGPDYNLVHRDHFHLETGGYRMCR